jgi:hypothetical protein
MPEQGLKARASVKTGSQSEATFGVSLVRHKLPDCMATLKATGSCLAHLPTAEVANKVDVWGGSVRRRRSTGVVRHSLGGLAPEQITGNVQRSKGMDSTFHFDQAVIDGRAPCNLTADVSDPPLLNEPPPRVNVYSFVHWLISKIFTLIGTHRSSSFHGQ